MSKPTAGQLAQISKNGYTENGEFYDPAFVEKSILAKPMISLEKTEPGGQVPTKADEVIASLGEAAKAIRNAGIAINTEASQTVRALADGSGKIRDQNTRLAASIEVFLKTARSPDFKRAIEDAERLAVALEKIAALDKAGSLGKLAGLLK